MHVCLTRLSTLSASVLLSCHPSARHTRAKHICLPNFHSTHFLITYYLTILSGLRDHLLAAQSASSPTVDDMQHTPGHENHHIDPQIAPSPFSTSPIAPGMEPQNPDVRKGRRELSTSKRAAQNRAAQVSLIAISGDGPQKSTIDDCVSLSAMLRCFSMAYNVLTCLTARIQTTKRAIHLNT